jgi:glutaredoxin-related protein
MMLRPISAKMSQDVLTACRGLWDPASAPLPVAMHPAHLSFLRTTAYAVTAKADGIRTFVYFGVLGTSHFVAALDRTSEVMLIPQVHVPPELFLGTVLDCELCAATSTMPATLLVFDVMLSCGHSTMLLNLLDRVKIYTVLIRRVQCDPDLKLRLVPKVHHLLTAPQLLIEDIQTIAMDGLVFTPLYHPIGVRARKPPSRATVDLLVRFSSDQQRYVFFGREAGRMFEICTRHCHSSQDTYSLVGSEEIVECYLTETCCRMLHPRPDKRLPNSMYVIKDTLESIAHPVHLLDLFPTLSNNGLQRLQHHIEMSQ